jgi:hypothetical protein
LGKRPLRISTATTAAAGAEAAAAAAITWEKAVVLGFIPFCAFSCRD